VVHIVDSSKVVRRELERHSSVNEKMMKLKEPPLRRRRAKTEKLSKKPANRFLSMKLSKERRKPVYRFLSNHENKWRKRFMKRESAGSSQRAKPTKLLSSSGLAVTATRTLGRPTTLLSRTP
jgi:hypothetical protein